MPPPDSKQPPKFLSRFAVQQSDYFADTANLPECGARQELLALPPLKLEDFTAITPLGLLSPTSHVFPSPHLYLIVRRVTPNDPQGLPAEVPVVAPADLTITNVKYIEAKGRPEFNDGFVSFGVCREFKAYFDHLKTFAPKIQAAFDKARIKSCSEYSLSYPQPIGNVDYKLCQKRVEVALKQGEPIGTAGGGEGQMAFDMGALDQRVAPKQFANPSRWEDRKQLAYSVCPLDYFPEALKIQLKERLGGSGQKGEIRNAPCGEVVQDVPGTAMGAWVPPGTEGIVHDPPHLALVHDYIEPGYLVFSMGDSAQSAGLPRGKYTFLPKNEGKINRHFKDIAADGTVYCFETVNLYQYQSRQAVAVLLIMPTPETLLIQKLDTAACGAGPWLMGNAVTFER